MTPLEFSAYTSLKIEQIVVCKEEDSWDMMEYMIDNCRAFFDSLMIPYRVVIIVSGALNNAAAMKYDLEAYFQVQIRTGISFLQ